MKETSQESRVLEWYRLIQSQCLAHVSDLLWCRICREQKRGWIPAHVEKRERESRQDQKYEDGLQQPASYV